MFFKAKVKFEFDQEIKLDTYKLDLDKIDDCFASIR